MIHSEIPVNRTDMIILLILGIMFFFGIRVVISFFKKPAVPKMIRETGNFTFHKGDKIILMIDGMMCGMCEIHVKDAIRKALPEAKDVTVSHESGEAGFTIVKEEDREALLEKLHGVIDPLGYRIIDEGVK